MERVKKVYGYVTRVKDGVQQVLVFRHSLREDGIQIPKGTVKPGENTLDAVIREIKEETGLHEFAVEKLIAKDVWINEDGAIHERYFYKLRVKNAPERWDHEPTGGGAEEGLTFHYFWIASKDEAELIRGHGDYLDFIFD